MNELFGIGIEVYIIILLLILTLFFIWRWHFRRLKIKETAINSISILMSVITAPIIYLIAMLCLIFMSTYYSNKDFDRQEWLNDKEKRYVYSKSLDKDKLLEGKTKEEVKVYLGKPDYEEKDAFIYYIGYKPQIIGIDPDWLEISFNQNKVSEIKEYNR